MAIQASDLNHIGASAVISKSFNTNDFQESQDFDTSGKIPPFLGLKWDKNATCDYL